MLLTMYNHSTQVHMHTHSPLYKRREEGGVEVQGGVCDLRRQFAEEGHQVKVQCFSHAFATFSQQSPKFW